MRAWESLAVLIIMAGCGGLPPPPVAVRQVIVPQTPAPLVPAHPARDQFLGTWEITGNGALTISETADGGVAVSFPDPEFSRYVVRNVRWVDDRLALDRHEYLISADQEITAEFKLALILRLADSNDRIVAMIPEPDSSDPRVVELVRAER